MGKIPKVEEVELNEKQKAFESEGELAQNQDDEDKLMKSVLENDSETVNDGRLLNEALNQGVSSFTPDVMFQNMVNNFNQAERMYGQKLIRLLSGYDPNFIKKNIRIPEFQRELKGEIGKNIKDLKQKDLLDREGMLSKKGIYLASLLLYTEELDQLVVKGHLGQKEHKKESHYGEPSSYRPYHAHDRYKDVDLKKTIKKALKRGHKRITKDDLMVKERKAKGSLEIIYAIDASGSMRGNRIEVAKKAGIALAFKAIENKDKVGLIIFGSEVKEFVQPTLNFSEILTAITDIKASRETNMIECLRKARELFTKSTQTKQLIILTDGEPTVGKDPEKESLKEVTLTSAENISTSLIGIQLDSQAQQFVKRASELGNGRVYQVNNLANLDTIVLSEYEFSKQL